MDEATLSLLKSCAGIAGIWAIVLFTQQTKRVFPDWPGNYWPAVALFWGVAINLALGVVLGGNLYASAVVGVVAGFLAAERYDKGETALDQATAERISRLVPRG